MDQKIPFPLLYQEVSRIIGNKTPLKGDCGQLCEKACCRGGHEAGMELFPGEPSPLRQQSEKGGRLALCGGSCHRESRPLACKIFPFFPVLEKDGTVTAQLDPRAFFICPIAAHSEKVQFDKRFLHRVKKAGELLSQREECRLYMEKVSQEIRTLNALYRQQPSD